MWRGSVTVRKPPHTNKAEAGKTERATGIETTFGISQIRANLTEACGNQRVRERNANRSLCTIRANKRTSTVRFCPKTSVLTALAKATVVWAHLSHLLRD